MAEDHYFTIPECGEEYRWDVEHKDIIEGFVKQLKAAFEHGQYRECLDLIAVAWSSKKADSDDSMIEEAYSEAGMAMLEFLCHLKSSSSLGTNHIYPDDYKGMVHADWTEIVEKRAKSKADGPTGLDPCNGCEYKDGNRCNEPSMGSKYRFDTRNFQKLPCVKFRNTCVEIIHETGLPRMMIEVDPKLFTDWNDLARLLSFDPVKFIQEIVNDVILQKIEHLKESV